MIPDPLLWDWSKSYDYYIQQSRLDLVSLKNLGAAEHLAIITINDHSQTLYLLDVKKSSRRFKNPESLWFICHLKKETFYMINNKLLRGENGSEKMVDFLAENHPDSLDWLLFHPE